MRHSKGGKQQLGLIIAIVCCLFSSPLIYAEKLSDILLMDVVVHIIDVGVGDAILIELPNREHEVLIDGGDRRKGYNIDEYLDIYVDNPIELGVITHPDYDHWSGIERILDDEGYTISELWDPGYDRQCKFKAPKNIDKRDKDTYLKFIDSLPRPGMTTVRRPVAVNPLAPLKIIDDVSFTVLYASDAPDGVECSYIVNNASIVIKMQYLDVSFLFTGDINGKERNEFGSAKPSHIEAKLLALAEETPDLLKADVLKIPHHGSETANTSAFIDAVQPKYALISSSNTYHYQLPAKRVVQRYQRARFADREKIKQVLYTNFREPNYESRKFGDDHIICGTNGNKNDVICDYFWRFEGD